MHQHNMICAGIDTGKRKLDVALTDGRLPLEADNDSAGHMKVSAWLCKHRVKRVGIEASGGYEQAVVAKLRRDGFVVIVFQPAQVRAYAKFHLQRAKNDKIDAALIAVCTAATRKIDSPPDPRLAPFAEHLTLVEQITEDITHVKTRREFCRNDRIRSHWAASVPQEVSVASSSPRRWRFARSVRADRPSPSAAIWVKLAFVASALCARGLASPQGGAVSSL